MVSLTSWLATLLPLELGVLPLPLELGPSLAGGAGLEFCLWFDFVNAKGGRNFKGLISGEVADALFKEFQSVEDVVKEVLDARDERYSLSDIKDLESAWKEFSEYLNQNDEERLLFERLMVFFFTKCDFFRN
ncbi:hypothetical protein [Helicobacter pylori]|uniref:hypothetical protein n=1 Tax=Helicobacter pylori TaxID=210 RepID=UPI002017828E|nr:hypothetical protein [Helicobacter pylori]